MSEMTRQDILPAVSAYIASLADAVASKRAVIAGLPCAAETSLIQKLSGLLDSAYEKVEALDALVADGKASEYDHNTCGCHLLQGQDHPRHEPSCGLWWIRWRWTPPPPSGPIPPTAI